MLETTDPQHDPATRDASLNAVGAALLLPDSRQMMEAVLLQLPVIVFSVDTRGVLTELDGRGLAYLGMDPDSMRGCTIEDLFGADAGMAGWIRAAFGGGACRFRGETPGHVWEIYLTPVYDAAGENIHTLYGLAENVTQRHRTDVEIRLRNAEITALQALATEVGASLEFDEVVATLCHQLQTQLNISGGALFLRGEPPVEDAGDNTPSAPDDAYIVLHGSWGIPADRQEAAHSYAEEFLNASPRGAAAAANDGTAWEPGPAPVADEEWQSAHAVPLTYQEHPEDTRPRPTGLLLLFAHEPYAFLRHRAAFFEMLGRQVGTALWNARLHRVVQESSRQLRHLAHRVVEAQEAERGHLARELHDEFGQVLTGLKMSLDLIDRPGLDPEVVRRHRERARQRVEELITQVRRMSVQLRPNVLDDLGLLAALQWLLDWFGQQTGIAVSLEHEGIEGRRFDPRSEIAAYRIVQEALTNVARHAHTDSARIGVRLNHKANEDGLEIMVKDGGKGFAPAADRSGSPPSSGLHGMRERAFAVGGTLHIRSAPDEGTEVNAWVPAFPEDPTLRSTVSPPAVKKASFLIEGEKRIEKV